MVKSGKGEKSFKTDIVNIDTAKVTAITIYPRANNHQEVKIYKEGKNNWKVNLADNKTASVPKSKVKSLTDFVSRNSIVPVLFSSAIILIVSAGVKTDSAKTAGYLRTISHLSSNSFEDNVTSNSLGKADYTLTIESASKAGIVLTAYKNNL